MTCQIVVLMTMNSENRHTSREMGNRTILMLPSIDQREEMNKEEAMKEKLQTPMKIWMSFTLIIVRPKAIRNWRIIGTKTLVIKILSYMIIVSNIYMQHHMVKPV